MSCRTVCVVRAEAVELLGAVRHHAREMREDGIRLGHVLIELKSMTPHGRWGTELDALGIPGSTARIWMRAARKTATVADLGNKTLRELGGYSPKKPARPKQKIRLAHRFWDCDEQHWLPGYRRWAMRRPAWFFDRKKELAEAYLAERAAETAPSREWTDLQTAS